MTLIDVEKRIARLEKEVQQLKNPTGAVEHRSGQWYLQHSGQFKNDPIYADITPRGRKYRQSLRSKSSMGKKKR